MRHQRLCLETQPQVKSSQEQQGPPGNGLRLGDAPSPGQQCILPWGLWNSGHAPGPGFWPVGEGGALGSAWLQLYWVAFSKQREAAAGLLDLLPLTGILG